MNTLADGFSAGSVVASIVASLVFVGLGYFWRAFRSFLKLRFLRAIWFPVSSGTKVNVFLTVREGPEPYSSKRLSLPEVIALQNIEYRSKEIGSTLNILMNPDDMDFYADSHAILLGGPKVNKFTHSLWTEIMSRIPFNISEDMTRISSTSHDYVPSLGKDGHWEYDFALVAKLRRQASQNFVFIFAGCHGLGTGGSTRLMTADVLLQPLAKAVKKEEFVAVLKVQGKNGVPISASIQEIYQIPKVKMIDS